MDLPFIFTPFRSEMMEWGGDEWQSVQWGKHSEFYNLLNDEGVCVWEFLYAMENCISGITRNQFVPRLTNFFIIRECLELR